MQEKRADRPNPFFVTCLSGLEEPVAEALRDSLGEIRDLELLEGIVLFASPLPPSRVGKLRFVRNAFLVLARLEVGEAASVESVLAALAVDPLARRALERFGAPLRGTFRLMLQQGSQLVSAAPEAIEPIKRLVAETCDLRFSGGRADNELWLHLRTQGLALFSLRLSRHADMEKVLAPGELRPELADLLCRLGSPRAGELFLDPFAGSGAIPIARAGDFPKALVLASDADEATVARLKERVTKLGLKKQIVVRQLDALDLARYEDGCIDSIVTDPPWGQFRGLELEPEVFYERMLAELSRVLKQAGHLVLLMGRDETFEALARAQAALEVERELPVLMSGRKATVWVFRRRDG